jgi:micrococcal nuclease
MRALFVVVVAALVASCAGPAPSAKPVGDFVVVARAIDGDTLELAGGERVRLIGVDTPETKHPKKALERFGAEASAFTSQLVAGKRARLEYDQQRRDRYGRTLAYVFLEDGTFVNADIIRQGFGFAYTRFPFRYLEEFRELERGARESKRGLWAEDAAAAPVPASTR